MTIQECYAALGGDYQEVLGRLYSESLVQRFVGKFLSDPSFQLLEDSLKAENYDEAFRAAHTLKGVSQTSALPSCTSPATSSPRPSGPRITPWQPSCSPPWRPTTHRPPPPSTPIKRDNPMDIAKGPHWGPFLFTAAKTQWGS